MNVRLEDLRNKDKRITFDNNLISSLILTQNNIIKEELRTLGVNLSSLSPLLNIDLELKKRADAAYMSVKERVDRAKRAMAATNAKSAPPTSNGAMGSRIAKKEVKAEATAPALAPAPPIPSIASAAATANPTLMPAAVATPAQANHFQLQVRIWFQNAGFSLSFCCCWGGDAIETKVLVITFDHGVLAETPMCPGVTIWSLTDFARICFESFG